MRLALGTLILVVATALAWLALRAPAPRELAQVPAAEAPVEPEPREPAALVPVRRVEPEPALAAASTRPERTALAAEAAVASPVVTGRVVLAVEGGADVPVGDGTLVLTCWTAEPEPVERSVEIRAGAFEVDVPGARTLSCDAVRLAGLEVRPVRPNARYSVADGPFVVRVERVPVLTLDVLDAVTRAHLHDVTIVVDNDRLRHAALQHPSRYDEDAALASGVDSPVSLPASVAGWMSIGTHCFVRSPGHAWKHVALDLTQGGQREVLLERAGELAVHLLGEPAPKNALIRLRRTDRPDAPVWFECAPSADGPTLVEDLASGPYRVQLEVGTATAEPAVLAAAEVVVQAGARTDCELLLATPEAPPTAMISGTIHVARAWGTEDLSLTAELRGGGALGTVKRELARADLLEHASGQTWAFELRELPLGEYDLRVTAELPEAQVEFMDRVTLEAGGLADVRFELSDPATLRVKILDGATGATIETWQISWYQMAGEGRGVYSMGRRGGGSAESGQEFLAPVGTVRLFSFGPGHKSLDEEVEVLPGLNELTFRLEPDCPLSIAFLDGDTPVPVGGSWYPQPEPLDGEGKLLYVTFGGDSEFSTALSNPGRYRFEMPEFEGFEPIPDQVIEVKRGERTRHVVQLVRAR